MTPELTILLRAWCEQHNADADEAEPGTDEVPAIGFPSVEGHAPGESHNQKHCSIGGVDAPEARVFLEGMNDSIANENACPEETERPRAIYSQPLPDEPAAADLGETSGSEEQQCPANFPEQSASSVDSPIRRMRPAYA